MKDDVERPDAAGRHQRGCRSTTIEATADGGLRIGALVPNTDLAYHPLVEQRYPLLSSAILAGASPQLRNMATTGGNLLQRTRCYYFYDTATPCNKREPGSGCSAIEGINRIHAILGTSEHCIATHPSDMCVALAALDAMVHVAGPAASAPIAFADFHRLPGDTPQLDTNLQPDELITAIELPPQGFARTLQLPEDPRPAVLRVRAGVGRGRARARRRHDQRGARSRSAASRTSRGATPRPKRRCAARRADAASFAQAADAAAARRQGLRAQRLQDRAGAPRHRPRARRRRRAARRSRNPTRRSR